jgi:hypothetical protein
MLGASFVKTGFNRNAREIGKSFPSPSPTTILTKEKQMKFLFYRVPFFVLCGEEMKCTLDAFQLPVSNKKSFSLKELE